MSDFVAALGADRLRHWDVCKREQLWGMIGRGTNWRSNGQRVARGDRIFVWRSGTPNGFIAQLEAQGPMRLAGEPGVRVPWDEPELFGGVVPIRIVAELRTPVGDRFPAAGGRKGVRFGFNNTVLQHVFEEVRPEIGARIVEAFKVEVTDTVGVPFRNVPLSGPISTTQPVEIDPDTVGRGLQAHHDVLEALAAWVSNCGCSPRLPAPGEPQYDLAWEYAGVINVAEVKSTTEANREKQLRLGLGQVLRYRHALAASGRTVRAWLIPETPVSDESWASTCSELRVQLASPAQLRDLVV